MDENSFSKIVAFTFLVRFNLLLDVFQYLADSTCLRCLFPVNFNLNAIYFSDTHFPETEIDTLSQRLKQYHYFQTSRPATKLHGVIT